MTGESQERGRPPTAVRVVGIVLAVAGAMYLLIGLLGVSASDRSSAVLAMAQVVFGAVFLLLGYKLAQGHRWAYLGAAVVLVLAVIGGVVAAISAADRAVLAQVFIPGVGLYLLSRRESRDHFMV